MALRVARRLAHFSHTESIYTESIYTESIYFESIYTKYIYTGSFQAESRGSWHVLVVMTEIAASGP